VPLFEIDLDESLRPKQKQISDGVHQAMVDGLSGSVTDRFQIFRFHDSDSEEIVFDPTHGGVDRRSVIWIRVAMTHKFDVATKKAFFRRLEAEMESIGIRHEDLLVSVLEYSFDDVYAGKIRGE
jgi:Tautomerase enzyme